MARAKPVSDHVTVRVLGASEITVGTRRIGMSTEALFALALYLTTRAGDRVPREEVLETFWPGADEEPRRHALRQMLYRLRQKGFAFDEDGDCLRLDPAKVESDLRACLSPTWPESATASAVEAALNVGPTFSTRQPAAFLEWFDGLRDEVSHQARRAAMHMIAAARSQGRWADLDRWGKAVLATDPLHEEATLARAEAAAMTGAKTLALEILDGYLAEIGAVDASVGKPAQVLRKRIAERRASWIPTGPREVALIGREEEMSVLTQAVESALLGKSRSVLLVGPSGYGKSRLLAEAREYAALRGVRSVAVRAEATLASHPWALIRELCRALVTQPGAAAVAPHMMETVRALLRVDAGAEPGIGFSPVTTADAIRQALGALIEAVSHEVRTLITVDDLQNADERSLGLAHHMLVDTQGGRCSIIAATHPAARSNQDGTRGRLSAQTVNLKPLSPRAARDLARETAKAYSTDLSDGVLDVIVERSDGHPLFVRELTLARARGGPPTELPSTLTEVVRRHLGSQPADSLRVLRIVALLAGSATISRVQRASGLDTSAFLKSVDLLSQEGVLHLDQARTLRLHDCWRECALSSTPDAVIATLALECAAVLQSDSVTPSADVQGRLSELYRLGGELTLSLTVRLESIDSLLSAGLYEAVLDGISREQMDSHSATVRSRLRVREAVALLAVGQPALGRVAADEVWRSRLLQTASHISEHLLAVGVSVECHQRLDAADHAPVAELFALAKASGLPEQDASRACLWGMRLMSNTANDQALREFAAISRGLGPTGQMTATRALTELIYAAETGTVHDLSAAYDALRRLSHDDLALRDRCLLLRCAAHALRISGQYCEAVATAETAYHLARSGGLSDSARMSGELLIHTHLDYEEIGEADKWMSALWQTANSDTVASTLSASAHMRDRLAFCAGRVDGLAERVLARLPSMKSVGHPQSRASELSLAAAVFASAQMFEQAAEVLQMALEAARPFVGRYSADVMIDSCLTAAALTGGGDRIVQVAEDHVGMRVRIRGLAIPPAFRRLHQVRHSLP